MRMERLVDALFFTALLVFVGIGVFALVMVVSEGSRLKPVGGLGEHCERDGGCLYDLRCTSDPIWGFVCAPRAQ